MRLVRGGILGLVAGFVLGEVVVWVWTMLRGPVADDDLVAVWRLEDRILWYGAAVGCLVGALLARARNN